MNIRKVGGILYETSIQVLWQKRAWVEMIVIRDIAKKIAEQKKEVYSKDIWVLLFCDNLSAHLDPEVKRTFGDEEVLLFYFPPNMTNFI